MAPQSRFASKPTNASADIEWSHSVAHKGSSGA
jgi:hypothetical protein